MSAVSVVIGVHTSGTLDWSKFLLFFVFFLFQSHAEDVLHNILLQSIHHHETDRKQVKKSGLMNVLLQVINLVQLTE